MLKENVDYELVPVDGLNDQGWEVRILTGDYVETVIRYGALRFDESDGHIHYDFVVSYTPDSTVNEDVEGLQLRAGDILNSILETAVKEESLITRPA